jgi:hypothetical protein
MPSGDISVVVITPGQKYRFAFSRVPNVGEQVRIKNDLYIVRAVLHTPQLTHAAEIEADLLGSV